MANGHGEGSTPAAWTTVTILLIASVVGGIAVVIGNWPLFFAGGGGLVVVGLIVGKAMSVKATKSSNPAVVEVEATTS